MKVLTSGLAIGRMARPYKPARIKGVDEMNDEQVRRAFAAGELHVLSSLDALRAAGREALADELAVEYAFTADAELASEVEPSEESAPEDDTSVDEASVESPEAEASEADEPSADEPSADEKFAVHDGAGWYSLSDSDDKMRGKQNVLDAGYIISED